MQSKIFFETGWYHFPYDPVLADWINQTLPAAFKAVRDPDNAHWLRCGGTWFAGVNALPNNAQGSVGNGPSLSGRALDFIKEVLGLSDIHWDRAQLSVCYPGYPQPMASESDKAFRYRRERDAAHVDGLLPEGPDRRRHLREYHSFLLGIPMLESSPDASPFVIWKGSHEIVRETFTTCFQGLPPERWGDKDITAVYHQTRRRIFNDCQRVEVWAKPGEAYLAHRLSLHGIAPWGTSATASSGGRMICYFRPQVWGPSQWLAQP